MCNWDKSGVWVTDIVILYLHYEVTASDPLTSPQGPISSTFYVPIRLY